MRAGRLDRRVTIERSIETQDDYGAPVQTWSVVAVVFAEKRDIRARERFAAEQDIGEETTVFVIRWLDGVTTKHRLRCEGKTYNIEGIAEVGRREGLEITATAQGV